MRIRLANARFVLVSAVLALPSPAVRAEVPRLVGYQGRLLRSDGTAATGTAAVAFGLYASQTGGSPLWSETQTLGLSDGYYATFLGLVTPTPDDAFDAGAKWLEIRVGSETLSPRQQVGSMPYAGTARSVSGGSASVTSLQVGGQTVVDAAGRLAGPARYTAGPGIAVDASQKVSLQSCAAGQVLLRDSSAWQCAPLTAGTVTSIDAAWPLAVENAATTPSLSLPQAGAASSGYLSSSDWSSFNLRYGASTQCGGDLAGTLAAPAVVRLQSRAVAPTAPANGQILKWSASQSQWEPSADLNSGGTLTAVTAVAPLTAETSATSVQVSMLAAGASTDGYLASADWDRFARKYGDLTQCGGDLEGVWESPQVARIQGVAVATDTPAGAQVLRFDGSRWAPAALGIADVSGLSTGYVDLTGSQAVSGAKSFAGAPTFGSPLAVASGGLGTTTAAANAVFAGPSGAAGTPSFRTLDAADIPSLDAAKIGSGTLAVARGGTGTTTAFAAGSVVFAGADGSYSQNNARFRWDDSNGRLGVGTSSPASILQLANPTAYGDSRISFNDANWQMGYGSNGSSTDEYLFLKVYANGSASSVKFVNSAGAELLTVKSGGAVGIGTSSPSGVLHVSGADVPILRLSNPSDGTASMRLARSGSGSEWGVYRYGSAEGDRFCVGIIGVNEPFCISTSGNVGVGTVSPGFRLSVGGDMAVGSEATNGTKGSIFSGGTLELRAADSHHRIILRGDASVSNADEMNLYEHGDILFHAGATAGTDTNTAIMKANGYVGIGTTAPGSPLEIATQVTWPTPTLNLTSPGTSSSIGASLAFTDKATNNRWMLVETPAGTAEGAGALLFQYGAAGASPTDRLVLSSAGNVGIGTPTPGWPLNIVRSTGSTVVRAEQTTNGVQMDLTASTKGWVGTASNHELGIQTNNTERVTVAAGGNVGIGTTSPTGILHVSGADVPVLRVSNPADGTSSMRLTRSGSTSEWGVYRYGSAGNDRFCVGIIGVNEPFCIGTGGNVGVGTTSPAQKLSVAGTIESTSGGVKFPDGTVQTTAVSAFQCPSDMNQLSGFCMDKAFRGTSVSFNQSVDICYNAGLRFCTPEEAWYAKRQSKWPTGGANFTFVEGAHSPDDSSYSYRESLIYYPTWTYHTNQTFGPDSIDGNRNIACCRSLPVPPPTTACPGDMNDLGGFCMDKAFRGLSKTFNQSVDICYAAGLRFCTPEEAWYVKRQSKWPTGGSSFTFVEGAHSPDDSSYSYRESLIYNPTWTYHTNQTFGPDSVDGNRNIACCKTK